MKKITVSIVTMLSTLMLTAPLYAAGEYKGSSGSSKTEQSADMKATSGKQSQSQSMSQAESADKLIGMKVVSRDGESIGEIQDLRIDTRNGRVNYVTVQKGGVMGIGGQEGIPVPLEAFQFTNENAKLTVDKTKLDNVPKQSNMSDQDFQRDLQSHYGISPTWQEGQSGSSQSGTQSMGGQSGSSSHLGTGSSQSGSQKSQ